MKDYEVTQKRIVPVSVAHVGAITGKIGIETMVHGGEIAIHVQLENGFNAWGFGSTEEDAELDAVYNARMIG